MTTKWGRKAGYGAAWVMVSSGFLLMTGGFISRALIAGRAPLATMYESILWTALGSVVLAMIMEAIHRSRLFFVSALPVAATALILAESQPALFDAALRPLPAVLRNNFWLVAHVASITLGYAALAVAMGAGHIVVINTVRQRTVAETFARSLYRSLQIGVLCLVIGTTLGGFWAYNAWGRFWGWDPKETWSLITLLCYIALLHGKSVGLLREFGLAIGSILAFQVVLMTWYGVNFVLGKSLHTYGTGGGGLSYVVGFALTEWVFVAVALVWYRRSRSKIRPLPTHTS